VSPQTLRPVRFFDPAVEIAVTERRLPHWAQAGVLCFVTWRTWDSMPPAVVAGWQQQRAVWLHARGIDPNAPDWPRRVNDLPVEAQRAYRSFVAERWDRALDGGRGTCPLRDPTHASVVADSLRHFDGDRYDLFDFVVMPNHVHLLAAFPDADRMRSQCESWKRYTAGRLNKLIGRTGRFWETDSFDHLVRSGEQYDYLRRYIADNPIPAGLRSGEFVHYSKPGQGPN
jgi:putative transposase